MIAGHTNLNPPLGVPANMAVAAPTPNDPAIDLVDRWIAAKAELDAPPEPGETDEDLDKECDRLCDISDAIEEHLFEHPATSASGALACLHLIEIAARRAETGGVAFFTAHQLSCLLAGAKAVLGAAEQRHRTAEA